MSQNNIEKKENFIVKFYHAHKSLLWEIFRFLLVGGLATIADYAVFLLFRKYFLPASLLPDNSSWDIWSLIIATALGFCVGLIMNWLLSISFVFRDVKDKEKSSSKKSFIIFTIIGLIGLGITELGMHLGVSLLPTIKIFGHESFLGLPFKEWITKVVMTCIVLVWNYVARKKIIFK